MKFCRSLGLVVLLTSAALAMGCGPDAKPPAKAQTGGPKETTTTSSAAPTSALPKEAPTSPNVSAVRISPDIAKACNISEPEAYFAFDSASLQESKTMDQVAACFAKGPLAGKTLKIVGHTDPRGSSEYNMTLGQSRADAVAKYVVGKGMDKAKALSSTRGEMDAAGTDEPSWAKDRRVDLLIGP